MNRYFSLMSILYFRRKCCRERKLSLAWFQPLLPKTKNGLVSPLPPDFPRKQIVTKLLDQSCKDIRKTQSDGWSSEEEDDVFDATAQEMTSPQTGVYSSTNVLIQREIFVYTELYMHCLPLFIFFPVFSGPPIVSEEELASLALISPAKSSQYSGSRVKALIQILQHQLDQQELVKEFMVCMWFYSIRNGEKCNWTFSYIDPDLRPWSIWSLLITAWWENPPRTETRTATETSYPVSVTEDFC